MKKRIQITADIFNDNRLIRLMDIAAAINPAKSKYEKQSRAIYSDRVKRGDLGSPIERSEKRFERTSIMMGTTLFGDVPRVNENDIKLIAEGGFDFLLCLNGGEYEKNVLDWCEKYGVPVISNGLREFAKGDLDGLCTNNPQKLEEFSPHPASIGDCGIDEPVSSDYPVLTRVHAAYNKYFPQRLLFSNLLAAFEMGGMLGEKKYHTYVSRFSKEVDTDYICADIYPFHPVKLLNAFEMYVCLNTYHTLSDVCRRDGKDFWLYTQSQGRWFSHLYAMTTHEMIKWQVYTALCYGCRCILHVSYNPVWGNDAVGMIDYSGNPTEQYLYVKETNRDIKKIIPVLNNYRSLGVSFSQCKRENPNFVAARIKQNQNNRIQGFTGIECVESITSPSTVITGFFANEKGGYGIMPVNCKSFYDAGAWQEVTVKLKKPMKVKIYTHDEECREELTDKFSVNIPSCEGVFVTLN